MRQMGVDRVRLERFAFAQSFAPPPLPKHGVPLHRPWRRHPAATLVGRSGGEKGELGCFAPRRTWLTCVSHSPLLRTHAQDDVLATTRRRRVRQYFYGGGANWEPKIRQLLGTIAATKLGGGVSRGRGGHSYYLQCTWRSMNFKLTSVLPPRTR